MPENERLQKSTRLLPGDYVCFDYGSVRIGLAIGNSLTATARPMRVVQNNSGTPEWPIIDQIVGEWAPTGLVVGIPLTLDGEEQEITPHARGFLRKLKKRFEIPVFSADERFSSMDAQQELQKMRARGQRRKTQHADVDTLAAALILERWFADNAFASP